MAALRFAAFGQDDNRLAGPEIGEVRLTTPEGALASRPLTGDDQGLGIDASDLVCRPGEGFVVNARWAMPDFGYLWLQADNGGQLYRVPHSGAAQVWNLNYELARTRVLWNSQLEQSAAQKGAGAVPQKVRSALAGAGSLLHDAMFANHDRRSRLADDALARALDAGERLAIHVARWRIVWQVGPAAFGPPSALRLATALGPDADSSGAEADLRRDVFGEVTVAFSAETVASGGTPEADRAVSAAASLAARVRGRALLPYLDPSGQPAVAAGDDERCRWRDAAAALARRYGEAVATWELVPPVPHLVLGRAHLAQIVETAEAVKLACPEAELVLCPGEMLAHRMAFVPPHAGERPAGAGGPMRLAGACLAATEAIDALALALYYPNCDLLQLMRTVDMVAGAGRPVHLLAAAAPSQWKDDPLADLCRGRADVTRGLGYWRRPWTPEVQAEYGLGLALLARAHPAVVALEWCDLSDARPHVFPYGGLLDAAGQPKPLHGLLAEAQREQFVVDRPWGESL